MEYIEISNLPETDTKDNIFISAENNLDGRKMLIILPNSSTYEYVDQIEVIAPELNTAEGKIDEIKEVVDVSSSDFGNEKNPVVSETINSISEREARKMVEQSMPQLKRQNESLKQKLSDTRSHVKILTNTFNKQCTKLKNINHMLQKYQTFLIKAKYQLSDKEQCQLLKKVFTNAQVDMICRNKQRTTWAEEDLIRGYNIRHLSSKKFYKFVLEEMKIPLPGRFTLNKWCAETSRKNNGETEIKKEPDKDRHIA